MNLFSILLIVAAVGLVAVVILANAPALLAWARTKRATLSPPVATEDDIVCGDVKVVQVKVKDCALERAEAAVKDLSNFAPRAKKIAQTVRKDLQLAFDFSEGAA